MNLKTSSYQEIKEKYDDLGYFCTDSLAIAIKNAAILNKPIVIEGPPGVGKTELAKATAKLLDTDFIRLQCSPEMNERKALYDFNYSKQLMFIQLLKEQLVSSDVSNNTADWIQNFDKENPFFSDTFLVKRPVLQAFQPEDNKQKVLLIDELDKADEEFEYSLLEAFSDYTISIPELGTIEATQKPITIVTSNRRRKLTDTFLRRAIYLYIDYPSVEEETNILKSKTNASPELSEQIANLVSYFRTLGLSQNPSIAETMEWAEVLAVHCTERATKNDLEQNVSIIAKNKSDQRKVKEAIAS